MAAGRQPRARNDIGRLAPEQRDVRRIGAVSRGRVKAEEPVLAGHRALGVETLDGDVVEIARPVHGRARRRLGDDQKLGPPCVRAHFGRQRGKARRDILALGLAQDAQARIGDDLQRVLAVHRDEFVAPIAQEGEMIVGEPAQESAALVQFLGRDRRRPLVQFRDDAVHLVAHVLPIGEGQPHVAQHARHVGGKRFLPRRVRHAVHLDVDERFVPRRRRALGAHSPQRAVGVAIDQHQRMDDEVQRQPVTVDFHRHRVDEERHVVVDDFDDRVRRLPAMLLDRRIEHAHAHVAGLALARKVPVRQRRAVQIRRLPLRQVLRVDLAEIALDDRLERLALFRRNLRADQRVDLAHALRAAIRFDRVRFHFRWLRCGAAARLRERSVERYYVAIQ